MTTHSIDSANSAQLRQMGSEAGLDFGPNTKDDTMRAKLREAYGEFAAVPEPKKTKTNPDKSIWVRVSPSGKDNSPISLIHNGERADLDRGVIVEMPFKYFEILRLAVTYDIEPGTDRPVGRPTYPYQMWTEKPTEDFQSMSFSR